MMAGNTTERQPFLQQSAAEPEPARFSNHEKPAQLRRPGFHADHSDHADDAIFRLRQPDPVTFRIEPLYRLTQARSNVGLERSIESEIARLFDPVQSNHLAEIARLQHRPQYIAIRHYDSSFGELLSSR